MPYPSAPQAFRQGAHSALPLTSGIVPFGLITGVTAIGMGLSPADAIGMTLLFYSGSAQMVVMQLMQSAALPVTMVVTALVINLRFLMYSASLAPHLGQLPRRRKWPMAYMLSDQSFALCMLKMGTGGLGQYAYPTMPVRQSPCSLAGTSRCWRACTWARAFLKTGRSALPFPCRSWPC